MSLSVLLTDLPEVLPTLEANVHANTAAVESSGHGGSAVAAELYWGAALPPKVVAHCASGVTVPKSGPVWGTGPI
eukprot:SAG11_NODE_5582_length_1518_cov_1.165610_1_plen_74_part_10